MISYKYLNVFYNLTHKVPFESTARSLSIDSIVFFYMIHTVACTVL